MMGTESGATKLRAMGLRLTAIAAGAAFVFGCAVAMPAQQSYAAGSSDKDAAELTDYAWTPDDDCSMCHQKETESLEKDNRLVSKHAAMLACTDCHKNLDAEADAEESAETEEAAEAEETAEAEQPKHSANILELKTLEQVHEGITSTKDPKKGRLYSTEVVDDTCLSCHPRETLVEATADCETLKDSDGTVVNPHDIPSTEAHDSRIMCVTCHAMHSKEDSWAAYRTCTSCHHSEIWECGTCHTYEQTS